jgi:hypothetical protein
MQTRVPRWQTVWGFTHWVESTHPTQVSVSSQASGAVHGAVAVHCTHVPRFGSEVPVAQTPFGAQSALAQARHCREAVSQKG